MAAKAPDTLIRGRHVGYSSGWGTAFVVEHVAENQPDDLVAQGIFICKDREYTVRFVQHFGGTTYRVKPQKQVRDAARYIQDYDRAPALHTAPAAAPAVAAETALADFESTIATEVQSALPKFPKGSALNVLWDDKYERATVTYIDRHGQERHCTDSPTYYGPQDVDRFKNRLQDLASKANIAPSTSYR